MTQEAAEEVDPAVGVVTLESEPTSVDQLSDFDGKKSDSVAHVRPVQS